MPHQRSCPSDSELPCACHVLQLLAGGEPAFQGLTCILSTAASWLAQPRDQPAPEEQWQETLAVAATCCSLLHRVADVCELGGAAGKEQTARLMQSWLCAGKLCTAMDDLLRDDARDWRQQAATAQTESLKAILFFAGE